MYNTLRGDQSNKLQQQLNAQCCFPEKPAAASASTGSAGAEMLVLASNFWCLEGQKQKQTRSQSVSGRVSQRRHDCFIQEFRAGASAPPISTFGSSEQQGARRRKQEQEGAAR